MAIIGNIKEIFIFDVNLKIKYSRLNLYKRSRAPLFVDIHRWEAFSWYQLMKYLTMGTICVLERRSYKTTAEGSADHSKPIKGTYQDWLPKSEVFSTIVRFGTQSTVFGETLGNDLEGLFR